VLVVAACATTRIEPDAERDLVPSATHAEDTTPKLRRRLVPPEVMIRSYLDLFGGLAPLEVQKRARGRGNLFDTWDDYLSALGLPDLRLDLPRATQTNAIEVATLDRLAIALCDRAVEHDLAGRTPIADRTVFIFEAGTADAAAFAPKLDALHRLFLGYPLALAPPERSRRFYVLFADVVARHRAPGAARSAFKPEEAGWAAVCYGLVRHPERVLY
jgi:hypothetical protein